MVYMFLGTGFEETEAVAPLDLLRRAGVEVATVGINGKTIYGSHGIGIAGSKLGGRRRAWHSKTFHSLRASVATMLQTAGISQGMAMQLVGHDSADVHAVYIRPTAEQLRTVADSIPPILPG